MYLYCLYPLIYFHAGISMGTMLYDLFTAFAPLTFPPIGQKKKKTPTRLHSSLHWLLVLSIFLYFKHPCPRAWASARLSLPVTRECPSFPQWMLTVRTYVKDYVIRAAGRELFMLSPCPPRCQFKAAQSLSWWVDVKWRMKLCKASYTCKLTLACSTVRVVANFVLLTFTY